MVASLDRERPRFDADDIEPGILKVFRRRAARQGLQPYHSRSTDEVAVALNHFLSHVAPGVRASNLARMGGGASKEQFVFTLEGDGVDPQAARHVLRMEPVQSISESDRRREFEVLQAARGIVPAPEPVWLDDEGEYLGQPGAIMRFVDGTTKPRVTGRTVSGLGTAFGPALRKNLGEQFLEHLVAIHAMDWRRSELASFSDPDADPYQAARWQLNWWARVWREDAIEDLPIMALAERWMREHLPATNERVLVHGDYRTGNYLFDEDSQVITAILDWELCHIGDFHQDLAWVLQRPFGSAEAGRFYVSGLFEREEFLQRYAAMSGREICPATLRFYEVLGAFECVAITLGSGLRAAKEKQNHQEVLLTWLAAVGHIFQSELCSLLDEGKQ